MKDIQFEGGYRLEDGTPAFVYHCELHDGEDLDGKFNVQFGAVRDRKSGAYQFAVILNADKTFVREWNDDTRRLVDDLIDGREFVSLINYDNKSFEAPEGFYDVLMGRELGDEFDHRERFDLSNQNIAALREIRTVLDQHT